MLIDWQRIRALLSIHLAAIHLLTGLSLRYKEWSLMRGYYGLLMEDAICSVSDGRFGEWEVPCELLNR